ncbi:MAG: hypothetical protein K1X83_01890 [Oligoflexia bacterium]|nr:hypothetical protein [Oligoflexia bacterium]
MKLKNLEFFLMLALAPWLSSCGGGSSGTSLGGPPDRQGILFSGVLISDQGRELPFARVTLLNTDDFVNTDEAGAFELHSGFPGGEATLEIEPQDGNSATLSLPASALVGDNIDLSIAYDAAQNSAERLALTLRARIVRSCSALFLNTRTIRQTGSVPEGTNCTIETQIRRNGLPANDYVFQLQHRGCAPTDPWEFSAAGVTGTSGPGDGEVEFPFHNDERHCVYRIIGPLNAAELLPLTTHLHTLRKLNFDAH